MRSEKLKFLRHTYYLSPGKKKARKMLGYWDRGCRASSIRCQADPRLHDVDENSVAVFYGATPHTDKVINAAMKTGHPFIYLDNSYFGFEKRDYFRATWNKVQHDGIGESNGKRLHSLEPKFHPWRKTGRHIVITLQSALYFEILCNQSRQAWLDGVLATLRKFTDRPIMIRDKPMTWKDRKQSDFLPFGEVLKDAWAVVTYNSATATEAMMAGVPAFVLDPTAPQQSMTSRDLETIEHPFYPDNREEWAAVLADNQWTIAEIANGTCIQTLNDRKP